MIYKSIASAGLAIAVLASLPVAAFGADTRAHVDASGANMQPAYPETAVAGREKGAVIVAALVRADGTVRRVALQKSSGFSDLDNAAMNAVNGWKFVPATKDGAAVEGPAVVQVAFAPPN
jgi:protein TonB